MPAVFAGFDMTAQGSGAAVLDRRHHLELGKAQMPGMGGTIGRSRSTEDIGNLDRGAQRLSRLAIPVTVGPGAGPACPAD